MGRGCLLEAGLFGDNILHQSSPVPQTFSPFLFYIAVICTSASSVLQEALVTGFRENETWD
jgi:hypothetical protein